MVPGVWNWDVHSIPHCIELLFDLPSQFQLIGFFEHEFYYRLRRQQLTGISACLTRGFIEPQKINFFNGRLTLE